MIDEARKPRICELLGVDVGEWFSFRYPHEAADAKTIIRLFGGWIVSIERSMNRCLFFKSKDGDLVIANKFLFSSISPGHTVSISDIVEEAAP